MAKYLKQDGQKLYHFEYSSLWQFLQEAQEVPDDSCPMRDRSSRKEGNGIWSGTDSFEEAVKLAEEGWSEGLDRMRKIKREILSVGEVDRVDLAPVYDVAGDSVDCAAYAAGAPEHMVTYEMQENVGKPVVRLMIQGANTSGISSEGIMRKGAALMAMIDALQDAGNSVEVTVRFSSCGANDGSKLLVHDVMLTGGDSPISEASLAFAVAHTAMFRRIEFSIRENHNEELRRAMGTGEYGSGYGRTQEYSVGADVYIEGNKDFYDTGEAVAYVASQMREQGIKLNLREETVG